MEFSRLAAYKTQVKDYALIIHAVPVRRLNRILPKTARAQSFVNRETGEELGFISVGAFKNKHFRPMMAAFPDINFHQITFQTYVQHNGEDATFFLGAQTNSWSSFTLQRLGDSSLSKADIEITINKDLSGRYDLYECKSDSERGKLDFFLRAKRRPFPKNPFTSGEDKSFFLTHRLRALRKMPGGVLGSQKIEHKIMRAWEGELLGFQCDYWVELGLLKEDEVQSRHFSSLITPAVEFVFYPPVPKGLALGAA